MKEIWKKSGLFYKLIAIMLTVVMVGTSLYFHFDRKYSAKAEGEIYVFAAYLPDAGEDGKYSGETGWQVVDSSKKVAQGTGRQFAFFIAFPETTTSLGSYKFYYTLDGNDPTTSSSCYDLSTVSTITLEGLADYKVIKTPIVFNEANNFKASYTNDTVTEPQYVGSASFDWLTTSGVTMKAKIGDTDVNGSAFNTLGKSSTMQVEISSPGQLAAFTVFGEDKLSDLGSAAFDKQSLLYTYNSYTYSFNTNGDVAKSYDNLTVEAKVDDSVKASATATSLKYDGTNPTVTANVDSAALDQTKWYKTDSIDFTISSGSDNTAETAVSVTATNNGSSVTLQENTDGTFTLSNVPNGINNIVVTATDAAGNSNAAVDGTFTFKVDKNNNPSISSEITIDGISAGFVKLNNDGDVTVSGTVSDSVSGVEKINVTSQKDGESIIYTPDDIVIDPVVVGDNNYSFNLSYAINTSGNSLSSHDYDGKYTLTVYPKDMAGNDCAPASKTFTLDTTDPEIAEVVIQRHRIGNNVSETDSTYWEDVQSTEITSGKYLVNKVLFDRIRVKVTATDKNFDNIQFMVGTEVKSYSNYNTDNTYYYEVPIRSITKTDELVNKIVVTDKALNSVESELTALQEINSDLQVTLVSIKYNGTSIADNLETDDITSYLTTTPYNGIYTITLSVKSGYEINSISMKKGSEVYTEFSKADGTITSTADENGVFTTNEVTFALPKLEVNEMLKSMSIYVEDTAETPRSKTITVGDLLYDNTQPVVVNNGELDTDKWYQDYTLEYEVRSGIYASNESNTVPESVLEEASYTIDGGTAVGITAGTKVIPDKTIDVPESKSVAGTKIVFDAEDKATNTIDTASTEYPNRFIIKVDKTAPSVSAIKVNGEDATEATILAGAPVLTSTVTDNLTIKDYMVTVKYNDETDVYAAKAVNVNKDATEESINYTVEELLGSKELKDGKYTVSISAKDKSDRGSNVATTTFVVDNTVPVVGASIIDGASGKNNEYYNSNVTVRLTCTDVNFDPLAMSITDNGSAVSVEWKTGNDFYYADYTASVEGLHNVRITGNDKAGLAAEAKQVSFVIDKTVPTVSLLVNGGQAYTESRGTLYLTGPLTLTASITDTNVDAGDLRVQIIKTVPDQATTTSEFVPTSERTFTFSDEADYVVNIFAIDRANNQGPTRTISFRVDSTAPQITITGANGGTSASAASISFNINEAFWADAKGTVEIYRKAGDGVDETLYKTLTITPTQRSYSLSELLSDTGIYRFEFNAEDRVGHTATTSQRITVDRNKPEIILSGVKNYDSTDGAVSISATISDEFYANKTVSATGTRTDATGKKTPVSFSPFASTANPTTINDTFTEEGIYDITIASTDIAGNTSTSSVHFTIDTSDPVIGDLSMFDNKTFNAKTFEDVDLDLDLDELVSDLTVCDVRMYLNGSEYDGISDIEDGSYTLLITAEDELGHTSEKSVTFILDTKEPIFIVTGVEDGEIRNDSYSIEVSLQLDEDTLDTVKLNDSEITIKNNIATLNVTDKGEYELYMKAYDEAGNEAEQTITFTFGEESVATVVTNAVEKAASHWWMWAIVVAAVLAVGGFIFILLKRKKDNE